jgi:hypothetical protein
MSRLLAMDRRAEDLRMTDLKEMTEAFDRLAFVIVSQIWWYQGGAEEALRALLESKHRDDLLLLMGDK